MKNFFKLTLTQMATPVQKLNYSYNDPYDWETSAIERDTQEDSEHLNTSSQMSTTKNVENIKKTQNKVVNRKRSSNKLVKPIGTPGNNKKSYKIFQVCKV